MAINFQRRSRIKPEISFTPLIDAAFILILFFAVTMNISVKPTGVTIKTASGSTAETQSPDATISIKGSGGVYFNNQLVRGRSDLSRAVNDLIDETGPASFYIKPDTDVSYKKLMSVVDTVRKAGGDKAAVSLAMEKPQRKKLMQDDESTDSEEGETN